MQPGIFVPTSVARGPMSVSEKSKSIHERNDIKITHADFHHVAHDRQNGSSTTGPHHRKEASHGRHSIGLFKHSNVELWKSETPCKRRKEESQDFLGSVRQAVNL